MKQIFNLNKRFLFYVRFAPVSVLMGSQVQFIKCFNAIFHNKTLSPHTKDVTLEGSLKRNIAMDTWNAYIGKNDIQERA